MEISTGRPVTLSTRGIVTSPHSLASSAGVDVLRAGGSAIDAAIAASAMLSVVYPHMTGLGSDAFWLIHDGQSGEVKYLNGGGKAAGTGSLASMRARGISEIPLRGIVPATLTVPGAVASWIAAHERFGRLPLPRVLESAILAAREGFPVTARLSSFIAMMRDDLAAECDAAAIFLADGDILRPGSRLTNVNLARTLEAIAASGWCGFYAGEVAAEMGRFAREQAGFFQPEDFGRQCAAWGTPLVGRYRDVTIFNTPPPTQGFAVLEMLNLIEPHVSRGMDLLGPDRVHLFVQAKQIAYHDRDQLVADPSFAEVPVERSPIRAAMARPSATRA